MSDPAPEQPTATPPEQDEQHPSGEEAVPGQPTAPDEQPAEPEPSAPADDPFKAPVPAEDVVGDAE